MTRKEKDTLALRLLGLEAGWATIELSTGNYDLVIDASDVPQDSFSMLLDAVERLLSDIHQDAQVVWFLEPIEIQFDLKRIGDSVVMQVSSSDEGVLCELTLSVHKLCERFLGVVSEFREAVGRNSEIDWSWPFPEQKFIDLTRKFKAQRDSC